MTVVEKTLSYADFQTADEIFSTGNFSKVSPITRIDDRELQPGPFYAKARELYWDFAHSAESQSIVPTSMPDRSRSASRHPVRVA